MGIIYTRWRADELSFENEVDNQNGVDLTYIEDAAIKANEQKKEAEKITARRKAPFRYYLKSYGPSLCIFVSTFVSGIFTKILWDKYH